MAGGGRGCRKAEVRIQKAEGRQPCAWKNSWSGTKDDCWDDRTAETSPGELSISIAEKQQRQLDGLGTWQATAERQLDAIVGWKAATERTLQRLAEFQVLLAESQAATDRRLQALPELLE
jgi:hypothetical protein